MIRKEDALANLNAFCIWSKPETAYILQLIARKKENTKQTEKDKLKRQSRRICVNQTELKEAFWELSALAERWVEETGVSFRMYVSVNRRDLRKGMKMFQTYLVDLAYSSNDETKSISRLSSKWKSILSQDNCRADKYWLLDIDFNEGAELGDVDDICVTRDVRVVWRTHSPNGMHWIIEPYDLRRGDDFGKGVSLCKDHLMFVHMFEPKEKECV